MMRRMFSVSLAAALALCVAGTASAATSIDISWNGVSGGPTVTTITPGFGSQVTAAFFLTTTDALEIVSFTVLWDNPDTELSSFAEWGGVLVSPPFTGFAPISPTPTTTGTSLTSFDGALPPGGTLFLPAGTYQMGTIVFNDLNDAGWATTVLSFDFTGVDGCGLTGGIDCAIAVAAASGGATINVVPEPATASLLGLGLIGLILAGRRKRA